MKCRECIFYHKENNTCQSKKCVGVNDSRITSSCTGTFVPDLSVNDLISNITVTCANGSATITATCGYEIPGVLKIKSTQG